MLPKTLYRLASGSLILVLAAVRAMAGPVALDDLESVADWRITREPARIEPAPDAAAGQGAIRITFPGTATRTLAKNYVPDSADWDRYQGLSFWVKGDGSDQFGCLAVGDGRHSYATYFPLKSTDWHQVKVSWHDLVPEGQIDLIGTPGALPPSGISTVRLGSTWTIGHNNAKIPAHSYCIDQIQLEETVPGPSPVPSPRPFADVMRQLKDRGPLRIQCMGDSITAGTGLANMDGERYATVVQEELRAWLGRDDIVCYSRAVGGAKTADARAWVGRDFTGVTPDLVTVWYGYNDKSNSYTCESFKRSLNDYIDRVCRATEGKAAVLLFATGPGCGPRFVMMDDFAEAVRQIAKERGLACFDMNRTLKAIGREKLQDYYGDMAHPNKAGHQFIGDALCEFLVKSAGITTPKPPPPPKLVVAPGKAAAWDFEDGAATWTLGSSETTCCQDKGSSGSRSIRIEAKTPAADHRRAFSPAMPVLAGQVYTVGAKTWAEDARGGHFGVYLCTYTDTEGKGEPNTIPIRSGYRQTRKWEPAGKQVEIPPGAQSMRCMFWADSRETGTFYCDDVTVQPVVPQVR